MRHRLTCTRVRLLAAACLLAAWPAAAGDDRPAGSVGWLSYREAQIEARRLDRPMLLQFTAEYADESKRMLRETYRDLKVIRYLDENFVATQVDADKLPSLARKYRVEDPTTLWFVDPQGKGLTSLRGYIPPEKLLLVLEFVHTKAYEVTDFGTWMEKRRAGRGRS